MTQARVKDRGLRFARSRICWLGLALAGPCMPNAMPGQTASGFPGQPALSGATHTVRGQVVNGSTGAPVGRALVTINQRAMLTDGEGRFEFKGFADAQGYASATKPGYSRTPGPQDGSELSKITDFDAPLRLTLYPDALITGTVTDRDGQPLAHVPVTLYRASYGPSGLTAATSGFSSTDSHGSFRFLQPAGKFRLGVHYTQRLQETGQTVMPVHYPEASSSVASGFFPVATGQSVQVDLHPYAGIGYPARLHVLAAEVPRQVRLVASTASGERFFVPAFPGTDPTIFRVTLAPGSYEIAGTFEDREQSLYGSTRLTVSSRESTADLRLEPCALVPIEVSAQAVPEVSSASSGGNVSFAGSLDSRTLTPEQLNLALRPQVESPEGINSDVRPRQEPDHSSVFHLPPGRYRLESFGTGNWHVLSANWGATNLLTDTLVIGSGSPSEPIRITATNASGDVNITAHASAPAWSAWIYVLAHAPALTSPPIFRVTQDGPTTIQRLAPGTYTMLALEHRLDADLHDPEILSRLLSAGRTVEVAGGAKQTIDVDVRTAEDLLK